MHPIDAHTGTGLTELIRQHRILRMRLADLVAYTRKLELERCEDCASHGTVVRAEDALATLEWHV